MLFSADQLRESIRLIDCDHDPVCHGYRWEIGNEAGLAELVGWTMEVSGEVLDGADVTANGSWGVVATLQLLKHDLP